MEVSPYKVAIIVINMDDKDAIRYANKLYNKLNDLNIETLLDDRRLSPGVKFNDIDLIGIPIRITVGNKLNEGYVEYKLRNKEESNDISIDEIIVKIIDEIDENVNK